MWQSIEEMFAGDLRLRLTASDVGIRAIEFEPFAPAGTAPKRRQPAADRGSAPVARLFRGPVAALRSSAGPGGHGISAARWLELTRIPYGETRSYQQMACAIGSPKAVRAVGAANGANPAAIVVPCHRVIGASGKLVGYGGGLPLKTPPPGPGARRVVRVRGGAGFNLPTPACGRVFSHHFQNQTLQIMRFRHGEQNRMILALRPALQHAQRAAGVERRCGHQFEQHSFADMVRGTSNSPECRREPAAASARRLISL